MQKYRLLLLASIVGLLVTFSLSSVSACGGLFCSNVPVAQQSERIIFTINDDDTLSAYVQINYVGDAPDFSWVVPVPDVPQIDVAEMETFDDLTRITDPIFIPPTMPQCAMVMRDETTEELSMIMPTTTAAPTAQVDILATGTAGPYAFDVITSEDPTALVGWLRSNNYRVDPPMEPLIDVYNQEGMIFLAMKLQPDQGVQDIQPIAMTYPSTNPMIPIRLTAVAATPDMLIQTWIFSDHQAVPANFAHPEIDMDNMRINFGSGDGTNYQWLLNQTVDLYQGRAFVTEYAQSTENLFDAIGSDDELLNTLVTDYDYVTRLVARMSPEDMTVDPVFNTNDDMQTVSNIRDLGDIDSEVFWGCEDAPIQIQYDSSIVPANFNDN